jgi:hypothetical protein
MRVVWVSQGAHEEANVVIGKLLAAKLVVAKDGSWTLIGSEGRRTGAKATSVGHAKLAVLVALKEALQVGISEVDQAAKL